ncbi:MAG: hypothetical protein WCQ50_21535 [Spirochaetota bacterium]
MASMARPPSEKQWETIKAIIQSSGTAWVEMEDGKSRATIEADGNAAKTRGYIRRFCDGEDFPSTIMFHTRSDLAQEASTHGSPKAFRAYMEDWASPADAEDQSALADLSEEQKAAFYQSVWEEGQALKDESQATLDAMAEESDDAFVERLREPGGVEGFLEELWSAGQAIRQGG